LHGHDLEPCNGDVAEDGTRHHVAQRKENGVPETVVAQKVFVQQQHSDVGGVPEAYQPHSEHLSRH